MVSIQKTINPNSKLGFNEWAKYIRRECLKSKVKNNKYKKPIRND